MSRFRIGQRVRITDPSSPVFGREGKVVRLGLNNAWAWVVLEGELPWTIRTRDHLTGPHECEEVPE